MQTVRGAAQLREYVAAWRRDGASVGLVPTMGNLHAGHHALLAAAQERTDRVVASIFVNPTQFGPAEDFASYPRTFDADAAALAERGCDLLFAPAVEEIYPYGVDASVRVEVPDVTQVLEGAFRPGHFSGVATVVAKLFNLVQPDLAVFGQKDYQQLLVIRRMVRDLAIPIRIHAVPTVRETSGLALSSRNQYLTAAERDRAAAIHRTLERMAAAARGEAAFESIEAQARRELEAKGLAVDYAVVRVADDLGLPERGRKGALVALAAARVGRARLIDNLVFDL